LVRGEINKSAVTQSYRFVIDTRSTGVKCFIPRRPCAKSKRAAARNKTAHTVNISPNFQSALSGSIRETIVRETLPAKKPVVWATHGDQESFRYANDIFQCLKASGECQANLKSRSQSEVRMTAQETPKNRFDRRLQAMATQRAKKGH
jgi:hypothetical protein